MNQNLACVLQNMLERQSVGALVEPIPSTAQLEQAIMAAAVAPDHHRLQPWRFILVQAEQRAELGRIMRQSLEQDGVTDEALLEKVQQHPMRAPLIVIVTLKYQEHEKVPRDEQVLSCGAAIQNFLLTLQAQGFASIWRSGAIAESPYFSQFLKLDKNDGIMGLIYIGTAKKQIAPRESVKISHLTQDIRDFMLE